MAAGSVANETTTHTSASVDAEAVPFIALFEAAREQAITRLSASQLQALIVVEEDEGRTLGALAERLGVMLSSASRLCDRLVAAGMLDREVAPSDRREVRLTLTTAGRDLLADLRDDRRRRLGEVLDLMSPTGRRGLVQGLREFGRVARTRTTDAANPAARSA
jgi:DNA-binding MarR family transcriptional regulator